MYCIILKCASSNKMFLYYKGNLASYKDGINMAFEQFSIEN